MKKKQNEKDPDSKSEKRLIASLFTLTIILSSITFIFYASLVADAVVRVPIDYPTIQDALNDPAVTEIMVLPGTYSENLVIGRSVILYALEGPDTTILDVPPGEIGLHIESSDVHVEGFKIDGGSNGVYVSPQPPVASLTNVSLKRLEVMSTTGDGIEIEATRGAIKECYIHDNPGNGLLISDVNGFDVSSSSISNNGDAAVGLGDCDDCDFTGNLIEDHALAFRMNRVDNCLIRQNLVTGDSGVHLSGGSGNIFEENIMELGISGFLFNNSPPARLNQIRGNIMEATIPAQSAVYLDTAEDNLVNENIITGPWSTGLLLDKVSIGNFEGNVISGPDTGVIVDSGNNLVFEDNVITDGKDCGVDVYNANNVEVTGNVIVGSGLGVATTGNVVNLLVDGNVLSENDVAVRVQGPAHTVSVNHNVVDANTIGIDLYNTYEGTVNYNVVTENTDAGIQVTGCDDISIANNEVVLGGLAGIRILDSGSGPWSMVVEANNISTEEPQPSKDPLGGPPEGSFKMYGIEVRRSNVLIQDNLLENIIHTEEWENADSGYGIFVKESAHVPILRNTVDGYQKYGILVEESPASPFPGGPQNIIIENNTVLGLGEDFAPPQSGIIIKGGANATSLKGNHVAFNWYGGTDENAVGIGVSNSPTPVDVTENIVYENQYGIYLLGSGGSSVSYNHANLNVQGIRVENCPESTIMYNKGQGPISGSYPGPHSVGIEVISSGDVTINNNSVDCHFRGIEVITSNNALIRLNDVSCCEVFGIRLSGGLHGTIEYNSVGNGKDGIVVDSFAIYGDVNNNQAVANMKGIVVEDSIATRITFNEVVGGTEVGISLRYDIVSYISSNTIKNHGSGISCMESERINIDKNTVLDCTGAGIYVCSVSDNGVVKRNNIERNGFGLYAAGNGNEFVAAHNSIEENEVGVKIDGKPLSVSIEFNQITRSTTHGVYIGVDGKDNTLFRNIIKFNEGTGVLIEGKANSLNRNTINNNDDHGIWCTESSAFNLITRNVVKSNKPYDAWDQGSDNIWINNNIGKWHP